MTTAESMIRYVEARKADADILAEVSSVVLPFVNSEEITKLMEPLLPLDPYRALAASLRLLYSVRDCKENAQPVKDAEPMLAQAVASGMLAMFVLITSATETEETP